MTYKNTLWIHIHFSIQIPRNLDGCNVDILIFQRIPFIIHSYIANENASTEEIIKLDNNVVLEGIEIRLMEEVAEFWHFRPVYQYVNICNIAVGWMIFSILMAYFSLASDNLRNRFFSVGNYTNELEWNFSIPIIMGGISPQFKHDRSFDLSVTYSEVKYSIESIHFNDVDTIILFLGAGGWCC